MTKDDKERAAGRPRRGAALLTVAAALALIAFLFRGPILRGIGGFLVVPANGADADAVLLLGGQRCVEEAGNLYRSGMAHRVLLIAARPGRLERLGILPNPVAHRRARLREEGVPEEHVAELTVGRNGPAEAVAALGGWLDAHPRERVMVVCHSFNSRRLYYLSRTILQEESRGRLVWKPLRPLCYDETNWWQTREGLLDVFDAYVRLAHAGYVGANERPCREWDPDDYEKRLP
jgi:hypothetical protein